MNTFKIRIAVDNPPPFGKPEISPKDLRHFDWVADAMPARDLNIEKDGEIRRGFIKSWGVEGNPQKSNRLELVIEVVECD